MDLSADGAPARRTAHEYVKDTLRQAILRGTLAGGTRLVQADIARELQVSTTPVREALRDLATEGLITLDAHRGAIVHRMSYDELREIHDICHLLEPEAMRRVAAVITPEAIARAESLASQMDDEPDPAAWAELNRQFHGLLVEQITEHHFRDILRTMRDSSAMYVALAITERDGQKAEANVGHREILAALRRQDGEAVARLSREHLELTIRTLESSRDRLESQTTAS